MTNATMTWLVLSLTAGVVVLWAILRATGDPAAEHCDRRSRGFFLALCVGLFGMASASLFAYVTTFRKTRDLQAYHARYVVLRDLVAALKDVEIGRCRFLHNGRESDKRPYTLAMGRMGSIGARLVDAYAGDPDERPAVDNLARMAGVVVEGAAKTVRLKEQGRTKEADAAGAADSGRDALDMVRIAADEMGRRAERAYGRTTLDLMMLAEARIWMAIAVVGGSVALMILAAIGLARATANPAGPTPAG